MPWRFATAVFLRGVLLVPKLRFPEIGEESHAMARSSEEEGMK
jgi:hypothetical protein